MLLPTFEEEEREKNFQESEFEQFVIASRKLYSCLVGLLPRDLRRIVCALSKKDGALAWLTLRKHILTPSAGGIHFVQNQMRNSKMNEQQDPDSILSYIIRLADELRQLGEDVPDRQIDNLILRKLPESYDDFVKYYRRLDESRKSLVYLKQKIKDEYELKKYRNPELYRNKLRGERNRPIVQSNSTLGNPKKKTVTCWYCHEEGHFASKCPKKKENNQRRENGKESDSLQNFPSTGRHPKPKIVALAKTSTKRVEDWSLDAKVYGKICKILKIYPTIDLCASEKSAKCSLFFSTEQDLYKQEWKHEVSYLNPPFKEVSNILKKVKKQLRKHKKKILMILPLWKSAKWYSEIFKLIETADLDPPRFIYGNLSMHRKEHNHL